ncbi:Prolyl tri_tetrapeptidyl aminopeptidase [Streptomyces sp. enrichment culture]|uniref:S28 family serine protease n=1 Tax=Streptomyces sp. enrichment culture TaxID=1795815 RepID=UPI003F559CFB
MRDWTRRRLLLTAASATGLAAAGTAPAHGEGHDGLVERLTALPGLRIVAERPAGHPGYRFFVLGLRQPVDHTDPAAGTFEQRLALLHTSAGRPTVVYTSGYAAGLTPERTEPTELLGGNQVEVEHRFFGTSVPGTPDWRHLTIRQAADDHHRVIRTLRRLLPGAWVSVGGSKGGMASVYHRRFHPHDVDGTVAYSAPDNVDDQDDSAYHRFLETVGTAAERDALKAAQRRCLLRRADLVARYTAWAASEGTGFSIIGSADQAFETAVLRASFMFWQNSGPAIPGPDATSDELYTWLWSTAALPAYADATVREYVPYFYQLGTQLGYFDVPVAHLADLLRHPDALAPRSFVPRDIPMRFDPDAMPDIDRWVRRHGHRMLFVNGERDPAVAEHFRPGGRDSRTLWVPGGDHHVAIARLSTADRAAAVSALARWTGVPLTPR